GDVGAAGYQFLSHAKAVDRSDHQDPPPCEGDLLGFIQVADDPALERVFQAAAVDHRRLLRNPRQLLSVAQHVPATAGKNVKVHPAQADSIDFSVQFADELGCAP